MNINSTCRFRISLNTRRAKQILRFLFNLTDKTEDHESYKSATLEQVCAIKKVIYQIQFSK